MHNEPISEEKLHLLEYSLQQNNVEQIKNMLKFIFENKKCVKKPFLFVCTKNILAIVKLFVKYKFGIDQVDDDYDVGEQNGFLCACKNGNLEIVQFLLEKNCGIDQIDNFGRNGFICACLYGNLDIVKFLLGKNCGIDQIDHEGMNSFINACIYGHFEIVKYLFEINCGINQIDDDGRNGFMWACINGHCEIVKFLFEKNCGIDEIDNYGTNGFIWACQDNNIEIIMFLYEFGYVPSPSDELMPFANWFTYGELDEETINIKKEERLNEIYKIETQIKNDLKQQSEEICHLIFKFIHGKENLKKDLFIKFRN